MFSLVWTTSMICFENAETNKPYHGHWDWKATVPPWFSKRCLSKNQGAQQASMEECMPWQFLPTSLLLLTMAFSLPVVSSVTWFVSKEALLGSRVLRDLYPKEVEKKKKKEVLGSKEISTGTPKNSDALQKITYPYWPPLLSLATPTSMVSCTLSMTCDFLKHSNL